MFFVWNLGSQEANLAGFNSLNNCGQVVVSQGSQELMDLFLKYEMVYPNQYGTERYADPITHPGDGRVAMPVPVVVFNDASQALKDELWSLVTPPTYMTPQLEPDWTQTDLNEGES